MENERGAPGSRDFASLLRHYRLSAGLSQAALAERARMSSQGIGALERGFRRTPQRGTLALLAGALALDYEQRREFEAAAARGVLLRDGGKASSVLVGPWPDTSSSNLPLSLASFVGRERELEEIAALVRDHRLVTLTGSGGVGKTQTALQVATALGEPGTAGFVGLAPLSDPSLVSAAIASALRVHEVPNRSLLETLLKYLKNRTLLLLLDNCEHVVMQASTVAYALLAGCPRVRILATSREPLRASGERTYRLPSLSTPSRETAARLRAADAAAYGAVELFSDRARAVDHRFTLTDDNAPAVAELCRRLDGIPLAIELAAAWVDSLSIRALAERLEARFRILAGGERSSLPRQQTMRATIDWSYDLLSAPEQRVFERLSVFAGGCMPASAQAVCAGEDVAAADVFNLISSLVDKSIVIADFDGIEPRYRLLESFRQYAREKLVDRGEHNLVAQRHALAYLELAERFDRAYNTEFEGVWRGQSQRELDNWRTALQWALADRGDVVVGQRLAAKLAAVWCNFASLEGWRWIELAVELIDERTPSNVIARLNGAEAAIAPLLGELKVLLTSGESALVRYRDLGDELGIARAQSVFGAVLMGFGRSAEAEPLVREALATTRRLSAGRFLAFALRSVATACYLNGDFAAAREYIAEELVIYKALGAERTAGVAIAFTLAPLEFEAGNAELALQHASEALATFRSLSDELFASTLTSMSVYLVSLARYDEAEAHAREALNVGRKARLDGVIAQALQHLAAVAALRPQDIPERRAAARIKAARILGFVDALENPLWPGEQREHDRAISVLRDAMGADEVANLMAEGAIMTEDQAIAEAP